jgi:hypothetical protein
VLARFAEERGIRFPLLSDPDSDAIKRFGLLNTVVEEALGPLKDDPTVKADVARYVSVAGVSPRMLGIAFPGTIVVDRRGRVTSRFFEESYVERPTTSSVGLRLGTETNPIFATRIETPHLVVTTYPSDETIAVGNHFALTLEIEPQRGMHVYAPGATGYRPIALAIDPQPFIRVEPLAHPPSEIYHFRPLNERVPVYQRPFRLVQDVVLEGTREAQAALKGVETLVLSGRLDYQACDDTVCFNPVTIPLTWSVSLRALVGR